MTELDISFKNIPKKLESSPKNDKFVTNKIKFVYCFTIVSFFMKLRLNFQLAVSISHVILSENLNETKKKRVNTKILNLF